MRKLLTAVALLMMIPGVAAAGGGGDISLCPGFATGTTVSMLDSCFSGTAHFAPTGTALSINNDGLMPHTFTAVDGSFDSGQVQPGETFELTIDEPGVFEVFCTLHGTADGQGMTGVLVVGEAEPGPVSASLNVAAIKEAVAGEGQVVAEALDRQTEAIGNLSAAQGTLRRILEEQIPTTDPVSSAPTIVAVPVESSADRVWVPMASGLAAGLALAALVSTHRSRRREASTMRSEGLQPSLET